MIPAEMRALTQWVCWSLEQDKKGRPTKVPYCWNGRRNQDGGYTKASSTGAWSWGTYDQAVAGAAKYDRDGIGFVFTSTDPYVVIDLDHCVDSDGELLPWAAEIVRRFPTYAEWSPSKTGLHLIFRGSLHGHDRNKIAYGGNDGAVEVYETGRFITVTNDTTVFSEDIRECQDALDWLMATVFPAAQAPVPFTPPALRVIPKSDDGEFRFGQDAVSSLPLSDSDLLDKALRAHNGPKFSRLWSGQIDEASQSESDLALCAMLAFWTNNDPDRIDSLFRQSGLMREKWDEQRGAHTYGQRTIQRILATARPGYGTWRTPLPVASASLNLMAADGIPDFPLSTLPEPFQDLVEAGADALPCAPDFIGVPLLALAGAAIGSGRVIEIQEGWTEGANLYAVTVGRKSSKKSPALKLAMDAVRAEQERKIEQFTRDREKYEHDMHEWEASRKTKDKPDPLDPLVDLFTTNTTVEKLADMLAQGRGVALIQDELIAWVTGLNQYKSGRGNDRQFYLSAWSRAVYKGDRKNNTNPNGTTYVREPALTVVGGIQPAVLPDLSGTLTYDDGFVDRLLWTWPDIPPNRYTRKGVPLSVRDGAATVFDRLFRIAEGKQKVVRLGADADQLFGEWSDILCEQMESDTFPERLRGVWDKMLGQAARIALILHCCETDGLVVSADTMGAALDLADFFCGMAARVMAALFTNEQNVLLKLLAALKDAKDGLSQTQILREVLHSNVPAATALAILSQLEEAGLVISWKTESTGGRKATYWRVAS